MKAGELEWGLRNCSAEGEALWGSRAILNDSYVDIVWNRQGCIGSPEAINRLTIKLNSGVLDKFRTILNNGYIFEQDETIDEIPVDGVVFYCSTMMSYGYLYITAVEKGVE